MAMAMSPFKASTAVALMVVVMVVVVGQVHVMARSMRIVHDQQQASSSQVIDLSGLWTLTNGILDMPMTCITQVLPLQPRLSLIDIVVLTAYYYYS
jgi:hypothetical protein